MLLISYLPNIIFFIILSLSLGYFFSNVLKLRRNINLGIDLDIDVSENSKIGYSYSHISNNDWGTTNPGSDNQSITFSKKF